MKYTFVLAVLLVFAFMLHESGASRVKCRRYCTRVGSCGRCKSYRTECRRYYKRNLNEPAEIAYPMSFKDFDSNSDSSIDSEEFHQALGSQDDPRSSIEFGLLDANGDKAIDTSEFRKAPWTKLASDAEEEVVDKAARELDEY